MIKGIMFLLYVFIFVANYSCSTSKEVNCETSSIDPVFEHYKSIIDNGQSSFILGTVGDSQDYRTKETIIYKRVVDSDFELLSTRIKGENRVATISGNHIYIVNEVFTKKLSFSSSKSILYKLNIDTNELEKVFDMGNLLVKDLIFENDSVGYALGRFSKYARDGGFLKTQDGGLSWDTLKLGKPIAKVESVNNNLYFLSYKRNDKMDWIYSIDNRSNKIDSLQLDLNITDFAVGEKRDFWLLGKDGDKTVLQHYKDGKTSEIKAFSDDAKFSPDQLYKYNDVIVVLASRIDKNMLGGFGGTKPVMYLSKDNGLTWINHPLNEALYLKPASFYKDERMTAYIGQGKVLTCSLKK
ncbi:beta propeller repeat protein [Aequorivita viscosa]|uniref:Uncharacterized protein n=1 Tax=Aequorivita viscosa TaxID=797419 RepID=A0A1M6M2R1_9FLAO|nr:hypothetical protein [Aequorivita viscosa]SDX31145.1 hypothetical protein SAMN05216556_12427 [Aequorivita viscosa]SHJ77729.1 hypothetical protein SAMN04487908_12533 [Aequorivita viscosa]